MSCANFVDESGFSACTRCGVDTSCLQAQGRGAYDTGRSPKWAYSGEGRGAYASVPLYNYVGEGMDGWNKEVTMSASDWKPWKCCLVISVPLLSMPVLLVVFYRIMGKMSIDTNGYNIADADQLVRALVTAPSTSQVHFDCDRASVWSVTEQQWCCEERGLGCIRTTNSHILSTTTKNAPVSTTPPVAMIYDCNFDFKDDFHYLVKKWHAGKRAWCCFHAHRGCPTPPPPIHMPVPHPVSVSHPVPVPDPVPDPAPAPATVRVERKPTPPPAAPPPAASQHAAPQHAAPQLAEPPPAGVNVQQLHQRLNVQRLNLQQRLLHFACDVGLANFATGWTLAKKKWCCQHKHKGCPHVPSHNIQEAANGLPHRLQQLEGSVVKGKKGLMLQARRQGLPLRYPPA